MATAHKRSGEFRKVGRNLFRYSTNKTYYAVFKIGGKKIWKSLETADRALADRKLAAELRQRGLVDLRQSRTTLAQFLELYEQGMEAHAPHLAVEGTEWTGSGFGAQRHRVHRFMAVRVGDLPVASGRFGPAADAL
jgi:hypothetical protein